MFGVYCKGGLFWIGNYATSMVKQARLSLWFVEILVFVLFNELLELIPCNTHSSCAGHVVASELAEGHTPYELELWEREAGVERTHWCLGWTVL